VTIKSHICLGSLEKGLEPEELLLSESRQASMRVGGRLGNVVILEFIRPPHDAKVCQSLSSASQCVIETDRATQASIQTDRQMRPPAAEASSKPQWRRQAEYPSGHLSSHL